MTATTGTVTFKEQLLAHFEEQLPSLYGDAHLRRDAAKYFSENGFPTRKWEDYKYIAPDAVLKKRFGLNEEVQREITAHDVNEFSLAKDALKIVVVNGNFSQQLSSHKNLPAGLTIKNIADAVVSDDVAKKHYAKYAKHDRDPFVALNTAMNNGGVFIHVAENAVIEKPVHIIHIASGETSAFSQPRNLVVAEKNSQTVLIESYETIGPVKIFTNTLTEIFVAPHAKLDHYRVQSEGENGFQLSNVQLEVSGDALYNSYTFTLSGAWVRNNHNIVFAGKKGEAHLFGLYLPNGNSVVDNHTIMDHTVPDCFSNELYKGVINDKATAVFNGKIFVRPDAQKTNAFQTNRNILLSDDATVNTKPQLEIFADDVKCSHGTSTGRLDDDALFYLRARGIGNESARKMLIRAFAEEVVNQVKIEELKGYIEKRMDDILR